MAVLPAWQGFTKPTTAACRPIVIGTRQPPGSRRTTTSRGSTLPSWDSAKPIIGDWAHAPYDLFISDWCEFLTVAQGIPARDRDFLTAQAIVT